MAEENSGKSLFFNIGEFFRPFALLKMATCELFKAVDVTPHIPRNHMSNANTNMIVHGGKLMALCESGLPYSLNLSNDVSHITTSGVEDYDGFITDPFSAHPKIDPCTGKMYGFGNDGNPNVTIYVIGANGVPERSLEVNLQSRSIMHDFAITKNHILVLDMPVVYSYPLLFHGGIPVELDRTLPSRIGILDIDAMDGADIQWITLPETFAVSHVVNAWEEFDGTIRVITCDMDDVFLHDNRDSPRSVCTNFSVLHSMAIDTATKSVTR